MKSKKLRLGLVACLTVVVVSALAVFAWTRYEQSKTVMLQGEAQALRERAEDIEADMPDANAPLEKKLAYYDQLVQAKRISGDHKAAVSSFEARVKLSARGLDYMDYLHIALSYKDTAQKTEALAALDRAEKLIPPDAPNEGFFRADAMDDITSLRSELQ